MKNGENFLEEIRNVFEPRYGRNLSQEELVEIKNGLTLFVESCLKFQWSKLNGKYLNYAAS